MKKYIAVLSGKKEQRKRFVTVSTMLHGRPSTFNTAAAVADAFLFDDAEAARTAAIIVLKARIGRAFAGGFNTYGVLEVEDPQSIEASYDQRYFPMEILKTPEGERRQPEAPEAPRFVGSMGFLESYAGAAPKEPLPGTCPTFDWKHDGDELYASLAAIIDSVDYTNQACRPNEAVGAVLDRVLIEKAKERMSRWWNQCHKFAATANPEAFGPSD